MSVNGCFSMCAGKQFWVYPACRLRMDSSTPATHGWISSSDNRWMKIYTTVPPPATNRQRPLEAGGSSRKVNSCLLWRRFDCLEHHVWQNGIQFTLRNLPPPPIPRVGPRRYFLESKVRLLLHGKRGGLITTASGANVASKVKVFHVSTRSRQRYDR